jgi:adenylylsulfate kinase-like enzyme
MTEASSGRVIWITGLSGAGKTTLSRALCCALKPGSPELVCLDGDAVRAAFGNDLGYSEADRITHITRMQGLAQLLSGQGLIVLVAALYSHPELLAWNRKNLREYFEIYLKASTTTLYRRDSKGLYREATAGLRPNVVGVDIPWHVPIAPDLVIEVDNAPNPEACARQVIAALPRFSRAPLA